MIICCISAFLSPYTLPFRHRIPYYLSDFVDGFVGERTLQKTISGRLHVLRHSEFIGIFLNFPHKNIFFSPVETRKCWQTKIIKRLKKEA